MQSNCYTYWEQVTSFLVQFWGINGITLPIGNDKFLSARLVLLFGHLEHQNMPTILDF